MQLQNNAKILKQLLQNAIFDWLTASASAPASAKEKHRIILRRKRYDEKQFLIMVYQQIADRN